LSGLRREISPKALIQVCETAINEAEKLFGPFKSIALSGQMGCWMLTDAKNRPITNIVSWQDRRAEDKSSAGLTFKELAKAKSGAESLKLSGNEFRPGLPIFGLFAYLQNNKIKQGLRFHSLISWVVSQLTINYSHVAHETDFAASGMFDIHSQTIVDGLEEFLNEKIELPEIIGEICQIGEYHLYRCAVIVGVGDQQASLYGSRLVDETSVINIGTGGQVASLLPVDYGPTTLQVRPYFYGRQIQTKTHLPAGRAINSYLSLINAHGEELLDHTGLFKMQIKYPSTLKPREVLDFEDDLLRIPALMSKEELQILAQEVVLGYYTEYRNALNELKFQAPQQLIFAGGVGQHFVNLQRLLTQEFRVALQIAKTKESTLQGLAYLLLDKE
jgi:xylulokinase